MAKPDVGEMEEFSFAKPERVLAGLFQGLFWVDEHMPIGESGSI